MKPRLYSYKGKQYTIREMADKLGIPQKTFRDYVLKHSFALAVQRYTNPYYQKMAQVGRKSEKITWQGQTKTMTEWADTFGIHHSTMHRWRQYMTMDEIALRAENPGERTTAWKKLTAAFGAGKGQKQSLCWDCAKQIGGCIWARTLKEKPDGSEFLRKPIMSAYPLEICISCPEFVPKPVQPRRDVEDADDERD